MHTYTCTYIKKSMCTYMHTILGVVVDVQLSMIPYPNPFNLVVPRLASQTPYAMCICCINALSCIVVIVD